MEKWEGYLLVKKGFFYVAPGKGNGDLIYNTCRKIIDDYDRSSWAYGALASVFDCLNKGIRWPDRFDDYIVTANHKQTDMTQDPWIMAYCLAIHLNRKQYIENFKPGILFWLPDKWSWRRSLLDKPNFYRVWRAIARLIPKQWFVQTLYDYMERAEFSNRKKI